MTLDGRAMCWGDNFFGSVTGNAGAHTPDTCATGGDKRCTLSPHAVDAQQRFVRVAAGDAQTCAVTVETAWWCWGGSATEPAPPHRIDAPGVTALATGSSHACALTRTAALLCQGGNNLGQLGAQGAPVDYSPAAVPVNALELFQSVAAGMFHTCAVTTEGTAYCWGGNRDGQLGNGSPHTCDGAYPCSRMPQIVRTR
ncbi:MAG TPA: hypothetical protein VLK84_22825 [Longimicrobium sp.]|nr:hypothetical protein [Longimicrobium sp.]